MAKIHFSYEIKREFLIHTNNSHKIHFLVFILDQRKFIPAKCINFAIGPIHESFLPRKTPFSENMVSIWSLFSGNMVSIWSLLVYSL